MRTDDKTVRSQVEEPKRAVHVEATRRPTEPPRSAIEIHADLVANCSARRRAQ